MGSGHELGNELNGHWLWIKPYITTINSQIFSLMKRAILFQSLRLLLWHEPLQGDGGQARLPLELVSTQRNSSEKIQFEENGHWVLSGKYLVHSLMKSIEPRFHWNLHFEICILAVLMRILHNIGKICYIFSKWKQNSFCSNTIILWKISQKINKSRKCILIFTCHCFSLNAFCDTENPSGKYVK